MTDFEDFHNRISKRLIAATFAVAMAKNIQLKRMSAGLSTSQHAPRLYKASKRSAPRATKPRIMGLLRPKAAMGWLANVMPT